MPGNERKHKKQTDLMREYKIKPAGIKEGESLEHAYTRLAKQADQRLVRLEQLREQHPDEYKGVLTYAYGLASKNIKAYTGATDKPRFNRGKPQNQKQLQAKVNDMIQFLNSPTSTKGGIDLMYKKRLDMINERYGTNFTWEEFARFIETKKDDFNKDWNSKLVLKAIGKLQHDPEKIIADLQESADRHRDVSEEEINDAIYEKLQQNGIDASLLLDDNIPAENIPDDVRAAFEEPEPPRASTAKKRTKESARSRKSAKSRKAPTSRYAGKSIAQIIRAVGQGLKKGARRRR